MTARPVRWSAAISLSLAAHIGAAGFFLDLPDTVQIAGGAPVEIAVLGNAFESEIAAGRPGETVTPVEPVKRKQQREPAESDKAEAPQANRFSPRAEAALQPHQPLAPEAAQQTVLQTAPAEPRRASSAPPAETAPAEADRADPIAAPVETAPAEPQPATAAAVLAVAPATPSTLAIEAVAPVADLAAAVAAKQPDSIPATESRPVAAANTVRAQSAPNRMTPPTQPKMAALAPHTPSEARLDPTSAERQTPIVDTPPIPIAKAIPQAQERSKAKPRKTEHAKPKKTRKTRKTTQRKKPPAPERRQAKGGSGGKGKQDARRGVAKGRDAPDRKATSRSGKTAANGAGNAAVSNYPGKIVRKLRRSLRYPAEARRNGIRGEVHVAFVVSKSGGAGSVRIVRSSGSPVLDRAALDTVRRAAPFPAIPPAAGRSRWAFTVPLAFRR